jgi:hypothetical protein
MATLAPLLIGISLMLAAWRQFSRTGRGWRDAAALHTWPTVTGTITESRVRYDAPYDDPDYSHAYSPVVRYEYTVAGVTYKSAEFGDRDPVTEDRAQAIIDRYPVGEPVTVYYDPAHPHASALEQGRGSAPWGKLALGLVGLLTGGVMVFIAVLRIV